MHVGDSAPARPPLAGADRRQSRRDDRPLLAAPRPALARPAGGGSRARYARRRVMARGQRLGGRRRGAQPHGSLGPAPGRRSRGELVLEALDHADAVAAAEALSHLDPEAYRTFNLIVADERDGFWLRHAGGRAHRSAPAQGGLSMIAAGEVDDLGTRRLELAMPAFRAWPPPDPEQRRLGRLGGAARQHPSAAGRARDGGDALSHRRLRHGVERADRAACTRTSPIAVRDFPLCGWLPQEVLGGDRTHLTRSGVRCRACGRQRREMVNSEGRQ